MSDGIARIVEHVRAASIEDRVGNGRKRVLLRVVDRVDASGRVEAVSRVPRAGRRRQPVQRLHGQDVGDHRRDHMKPAEAPAIEIVTLGLREIGHDRRRPGIVLEECVVGIGRGFVVIAGVTQAERMADLVKIGLVGVTADVRAGSTGWRRQPGSIDVDEHRRNEISAEGPYFRECAPIRVVVGEEDVRRGQ